ncbi:preQ(1) synthase [Helicobacter macacae]|uniref:NADPH-dependent 7-cyano-7-deazaguanine reductase n=1 Tax=Helicobacter macacae MIT 99-5501 TaxID=1357400 RepID=V8CDJ3_9HELI|nr:preQ(1) synthase [Helicobacter macacae]ETD25085.1 NADPH-dependent 7-cyano-7-deazaguanine reductase [Helicobacter macacae MIT 99-5501]
MPPKNPSKTQNKPTNKSPIKNAKSTKQSNRYGEKQIQNFTVQKDLELWQNTAPNDYIIKITLPEFCCLCPRSGYPDFATLRLEYIPDKWLVELKAIKLYINSFMSRHISHEASINEIYSTLKSKLKPKWIKLTAEFNPRGNVHTTIEVRSDLVVPKKPKF